jgi:uncharacterized membrane protein YeaQ/YmgE (transglycosylase-associated protein family)
LDTAQRPESAALLAAHHRCDNAGTASALWTSTGSVINLMLGPFTEHEVDHAPIFPRVQGGIMDLNPGGLIAWLLVGLVAGWLAGQFMKGGGYGLIGDIIMGIIGAFVGGLLFSFLLPGSSVGLLGSIIVAFIGAVVLIALVRALPGRSPV